MSNLESKSEVHGGVFWILGFMGLDFKVKPTIRNLFHFLIHLGTTFSSNVMSTFNIKLEPND